jgi:hypothetical protein
MSPKTKVKQEWPLASVALRDAYTDFMLSRQAMLGYAGPEMVQHYTQIVDENLPRAHSP